jgi:hypothetical protein
MYFISLSLDLCTAPETLVLNDASRFFRKGFIYVIAQPEELQPEGSWKFGYFLVEFQSD